MAGLIGSSEVRSKRHRVRSSNVAGSMLFKLQDLSAGFYPLAVDPRAIANALKLQPCHRRRGSLRADGHIYTGMWAYNGQADANSPEWDSLEEALRSC